MAKNKIDEANSLSTIEPNSVMTNKMLVKNRSWKFVITRFFQVGASLVKHHQAEQEFQYHLQKDERASNLICLLKSF